MFRTLLIFIWQKKLKRDIPPHKYVCLSQEAVRWQKPRDCKSRVLARQHRQDGKKGKGKLCLLSYLRPPWLGMLSRPWSLTGFVPLVNRGWLTQPGRCPWSNLFVRSTVSYVLAGTRVPCGTKAQGIWRQGSASLDLLLARGSQLSLVPESAASYTSTSAPQQCTVVLERLARAGCLCDALGERLLRLKPFQVSLGTFLLISLPKKQTFPLRFWLQF